MPARTPITTDPAGLSFFIQREGESLPANHYLRELPLNSFEAGATTVWIDDVEEDGTGRLLARVSDDGHGMSEDALREHIKTIHCSSKGLGEHHGLGARVATLARNHYGVTWASRHDGEENMVRVIRDYEGVFRLERWELEGGGLSDVVDPDEGQLDRIVGDGTAVILHGSNEDDTWTSTNEVMGYLIDRWWQLPGEIKVWHSDPAAGSYFRTANGMSEWAGKHATDRGVIEVEVEGLGPISIHWFLLKAGVDNPMGVRKGQIGAMLDNEMFRWSSKSNRMVDFGISSRSAQERFVAVVELPDDWRMNTGRDDVERIGGDHDIDWAKIGRAFVEDMPPVIAELLAASVTGRSKAHLFRARFGKRWEQMTKRLPKGKDFPSLLDGDEEGVGKQKVRRKRRRGPVVNPGLTRREVLATGIKRRSQEREDFMVGKGRTLSGINFPEVVWVTEAEYPGERGRFAIYIAAANEIHCRVDHFLVIQAVDWYASEYGNVARSEIEARLKEEYELEIVAKVLHAGVFHDDPDFTEEDMGKLLSEESLTLSMMGMQAIDGRVTAALRKVGQ